jgi:ABC-2 type transport system ATP-binding protein
VKELHARGATVILTTHYLEEAEQLCERIAIINHGKVVANEATSTLLSRAQEKNVVVTVDRDLAAVPANICFDKVVLEGNRSLAITYQKDKVNAGEVIAALQGEGLGIVDVVTREPDLEDVFLQLVRS